MYMATDTATAIHAMAIRIDELIKSIEKLKLGVDTLLSRDLEHRIAALDKNMKEMSIKIDTLSSDGITLVTASPVVVETKGEVKAKAAADTETKSEVSTDPGNINGNIKEFWKIMWIDHFDILKAKGLITEEFQVKRDKCIEHNAGNKTRELLQQRSIANSAYTTIKDGPLKDILVALRHEFKVKLAKSSALSVNAEVVE
jgi:hypothetical protein